MRRGLLLATILATVFATVFALGGCRGEVTTKPPRRLWDDMVWQPKLRPESRSAFFADGRGMRPPVEGTVAQGALELPARPAVVDEALARRGQERFDIYCSPCHDRAGSGHGMVVQRGFPLPIDLASDRARGLTDQQLFETITHGARNMPSYGAQIPPADRWAIAVWVRVLQRSQHATLADVPEAERARIAPQENP